MPKASQETASEKVEVDGYSGRFERFPDNFTVAFESYTADADLAPLFDGLPDNRCQAPHWGYVIEGRVAFQFSDSEEVYETGDAYYAPPGHTPRLFAGTRVVEFSPTDALNATIEVVERNMTQSGA